MTKQPPLWELYREQLEALTVAQLNFDLEQRASFTEASGWHLDDVRGELPTEAPGEPQPGGSWRTAQEVVRSYRFPDPGIITGIFYPDHPLEQRVMLLRGRFLFWTFFFGVRVGGVIDEVRQGAEGPEHVWGFSYQTLKGHFEKGQMTFEVIKHLESGKVFFRIHAFSRAAEIPNIFYRIGFRLFGRRLQQRFMKRSIARMQRLVAEDMIAQAQAKPTPADDGPTVAPASSNTEASEALEEVEAAQPG